MVKKKLVIKDAEERLEGGYYPDSDPNKLYGFTEMSRAKIGEVEMLIDRQGKIFLKGDKYILKLTKVELS